MHKLIIPPDFKMSTDSGQEIEMTFAKYVELAILQDLRWSVSFETLCRRSEVQKLFKDVVGGDEVPVEDQDINFMKECVRKPQIGAGGGLVPNVAGQLLDAGYMHCIIESKKSQD